MTASDIANQCYHLTSEKHGKKINGNPLFHFETHISSSVMLSHLEGKDGPLKVNTAMGIGLVNEVALILLSFNFTLCFTL